MTDESAQLGPSYDGTVMLDIGGDIGALIIMTDAELHLIEIEISPAGDERAAVPAAELAHDHGHAHDDDHGHDHVHPEGQAPNHPNRTHVAVRERRGPSGIRYAAIYPSLREGEYTVWGVDRLHPHVSVSIVGGRVTEIDW